MSHLQFAWTLVRDVSKAFFGLVCCGIIVGILAAGFLVPLLWIMNWALKGTVYST